MPHSEPGAAADGRIGGQIGAFAGWGGGDEIGIAGLSEFAALAHNGQVVSRVEPFRVTFVCTGNICRSPMAEIVFRDIAERVGMAAFVASSSSGTGDWHVGERADARTLDALHRRGYDGRRHRARQFSLEDFERNDLVVTLDRSHERILTSWARTSDDTDKLALLLSFDVTADALDVPDPYYAGPEMFDEVLGMIESASRALFRQLEPAIRAASPA